jgi:hypothetical protein
LVSPEQLSAAAAQQRERFPTHLIGQVLVGMGLVAQEVVDAFVLEQVLDQLADLLDLPIEDAQFHPGRRIQQDVIAPTDFNELLVVACQRRAHRANVLAAVGGPQAVPALGAPGRGSGQTPLGPYDWALLCRVDGRRTITELARVCGFTVQESAQIVADLALTGLLVLPPPPEVPDEPLAEVVTLRPEAEPTEPLEPQWHFAGTAAGEPEPVGNLLAEFSAFVHDEPDLAAVPAAGLEPPEADESTLSGQAWPAVAADPDPGASTGEPTTVYDLGMDAIDGPLAPDPVEAHGSCTVEEPFEEPGPPDLAQQPGLPESPVPSVADVLPQDEPEPQSAAEPAPPVPSAADAPSAPGVGGARFPDGAPVAPPADAGYSDTSVFMRELSSLSDVPESEAAVVTRLVVPLTEQPKARKRRFWAF